MNGILEFSSNSPKNIKQEIFSIPTPKIRDMDVLIQFIPHDISVHKTYLWFKRNNFDTIIEKDGICYSVEDIMSSNDNITECVEKVNAYTKNGKIYWSITGTVLSADGLEEKTVKFDPDDLTCEYFLIGLDWGQIDPKFAFICWMSSLYENKKETGD